jgi:hypothetical protein
MANVKITDLSAGTALGGSELFEAVQSSTSVKISATQVKNFANDSVSIVGGTLSSVTISNATGSFNSITVTAGTVPFNTITGRAIAQFESHADQTAVSANVAYTANMNNAASFNTGITIASSTNVTVAAAGIYSINTSIQFANSDSNDHDVTFWFTKNGTNIPNSASKLTVPKAGDGGQALAQVTIFESLAISNYVQLIWAVENTAVTLDYSAASGVIPEIPSLIFNIQRIA